MFEFIDTLKEKIVNPIKDLFNYNQGYFSGCIDVVVIRHKTINQYVSTQFHVRFGSTKILKPLDSYCHIEINGVLQKHIKNMKLGQFGEAYFSVKDPKLNKKVKRLRLTSEELQSMNLQYGMNRVRYIVDSKLQGIQIVEGKIFMYDSQNKFVISDIDGTITKSDVMGHILSTFNKDWTHPDIAQLYTNIYKQGYQLIYLTARSYSQYEATYDLLKRIKQDQYVLPDGPILMSPDSLGKSFKREVIYKKAEYLKCAILKDLKSLFTIENKVHVEFPFYSGFGNRETDAIAYKVVDIPFSNIYIINTQSQIRMLGMKKIGDQSYFWLSTSYREINENIPIHFPSFQQFDFIDWQKQLLEKKIFERMKSFNQISNENYANNGKDEQPMEDFIIEETKENFHKRKYATF